jgi:hypothetical protein
MVVYIPSIMVGKAILLSFSDRESWILAVLSAIFLVSEMQVSVVKLRNEGEIIAFRKRDSACQW